MNLSLFDLHCDTPYEMLRKQQALADNNLAISLQKAAKFSRYVQIMAFWCNKELEDEAGWLQFEKLYHNLVSDPSVKDGTVQIVSQYPLESACKNMLLLAIEDLRIVANDIKRVDLLFDKGIRIVTPLWANDSGIGGAHNTENGLTDFGKAALTRALNLGMLLDISHASLRSAHEMLELSENASRPVLATHSNAYKICPVSRNLRDSQIQMVIKSGGLIGLNLYRNFIQRDGCATIDTLCLHIEHFLSLGAINALCLGTDFDGCETLDEIRDLSELSRLAERLLQLNYPEQTVHKIFFANADLFAKKHLTL